MSIAQYEPPVDPKEEELIQQSLDGFNFVDAVRVLRDLGGFHAWTVEEMRETALMWMRRLAREPRHMRIMSGGLTVCWFPWGKYEIYCAPVHN